jgi:hypothetical protein
VPRAPGDLRRVLALLAGLFAPLILLAPLYTIGDALDQGRALVFPAACWIAILALGFDRGFRSASGRAWVVAAAALLAIASAILLPYCLAPFASATRVAEGAIEELDTIPPGESLLLLRVEDPPGVMRPDLVTHHGAYVLSAGIYSALRPPWRPAPGINVQPVYRSGTDASRGLPVETDLAAAAPPELARPWLATVVTDHEHGRPHVRILASGGSSGREPDLLPPHGAVFGGEEAIRLSVTMPEERWRLAPRLVLHVAEPSGVTAAIPFSEGDVRAGLADSGTFTIPPDRIPFPATPAELRRAGVQSFVWWVEGFEGDALRYRSAWRAVTIPPAP